MLKVAIKKSYPEAPGSSPFSLDIAFEAPLGVTALFGPSGAGKTLTLGSIAGFTRPDSGRIAVGDTVLFDSGQRIDLPARKRRCGYLFQQDALFPHMTVRENVAFAARDAAAVDALLVRFRIDGLASRRPRQISGGERQRCAIARTLASRPRLLLMDEPGQGLDIVLRRELHRTIVDLRRELDAPLLLVTHDLSEAFALADHMLVIDGGRIYDRGAPEAVYQHPSSKRTARLLGIDGVFDGRVVERDAAGWARIESDTGIAVSAFQLDREPGSSVSFCLRPEAVIATPRNGTVPDGELPVTLDRVESGADRVRLHFVGGVAADIAPERYRRLGKVDEWTLRFPEDAVWVFPR